MTATLTERYVEATTRALADAQRAEVGRELRATIEDMIEGRMQTGTASREEAERAVLVELGDPALLAAGYSGRPLHLIGPAVYLDWLRLTKLLLVTIVPIVTGIRLVVGAFETDVTVGSVVVDTLRAALFTTVSIGFWTTAGFAVVERLAPGATPLTRWDPDLLPEPRRGGIGLVETVGSVVTLVLVGVALVWQHTSSPVVHDGEPVPILDPSLWSSWLLWILAMLAVELALTLALFRAGRWTWPLALANLAVNVGFAVPLLLLLAGGDLFNAPFLTEMAAGGWTTVERDLTVTTSVGVLLVTAWASLDGLVKAGRA